MLMILFFSNIQYIYNCYIKFSNNILQKSFSWCFSKDWYKGIISDEELEALQNPKPRQRPSGPGPSRGRKGGKPVVPVESVEEDDVPRRSFWLLSTSVIKIITANVLPWIRALQYDVYGNLKRQKHETITT